MDVCKKMINRAFATSFSSTGRSGSTVVMRGNSTYHLNTWCLAHYEGRVLPIDHGMRRSFLYAHR